MIEYVRHGDRLFGLIIRSSFRAEGIAFFTPGEFSQQLGYMNRPKGYKISPHSHNEVKREVLLTNEVLFIKSGKVRVDFYQKNEKYLESELLMPGDVILLASESHGFEMLEPSEMIEVKQGPYAGEDDKTIHANLSPDKIIINND
jgi:mannose-6-phosphate isomerase-like protein (cupin superfamily)